MLKRHLLIFLLGTLTAMAGLAAEEAKPAAAPTASTKPVEVTAKADAGEAKTSALSRKRARWSRPGLDLTHCLSKETNVEVIRCVE